jgi:hypothetical protein
LTIAAPTVVSLDRRDRQVGLAIACVPRVTHNRTGSTPSDMARNHTQHRTMAIALLILALASCSLTACSSSSNSASQARSASPQEIAIQKRRDAGILELVSCARRHGIHLPPPTAAGVNVSGVKGRRREEAVSACYHKVLKKSEREAQAERAK